jgi:hypothetical protein
MPTLRVAIISTPRSGNTWLLHLLSKMYQAPTFTVHTPLEVDWDNLPPACILQLHWHPEPTFLPRLEKGGFRAVVLARHPLDVLNSILHFSIHDPTARWLEGEGGNERSIFGAMPRSTAFLDYATGPRARALLSISREWWNLPDCHALHYEALVASTEAELYRLVEAFSVAPVVPIEEAVAATTLPKMRQLTQNNNHFWQGQSNLWKKLLTMPEAQRIADAHAAVFAQLGYLCDADPDLKANEADANWVQLVWAPITEKLHGIKLLNKSIAELEGLIAKKDEDIFACHAEINTCRTELGRLHSAYVGLEGLNANLREHHTQLFDHYKSLVEGLTPESLELAERVGRITRKHPQTAALVKRVIRMAS